MAMKVFTRIGISPFSAEQHIGVYRSFLVNIFISQYYGGKTLLRIDDTFYTKIMQSSHFVPTINNITSLGVSIEAIKSYLYGIITGKSEELYRSFSAALKDFSPVSILPGIFYFDIKKIMSIERML